MCPPEPQGAHRLPQPVHLGLNPLRPAAADDSVVAPRIAWLTVRTPFRVALMSLALPGAGGALVPPGLVRGPPESMTLGRGPLTGRIP
jgi:hypothetical protein